MADYMTKLSSFLIPAILFFIIGYGLCKKVKVYEAFLAGAKEGLKTVAEILPTLVGLMMAVGILRASGLLTRVGDVLSPLTKVVGIPGVLLPLLIIKLFSSSAATGLVLDIFKTCGPDSYEGILTSILMSCTETLFYTMSVYYLAAKVTKTRYTLAGALWSILAGTIMSVLLTGWMCR